MSESTTTPSFGQRVARFFAALLRLLLWTLFLLLILGGLGVLIAWGIPYVDRNIVQPLQDARARITQLESAQSEWTQRVRANEERLQTLDDRLNDVAATQQALMDDLQDLQDQLENLADQQTDLNARIEDIRAEIAALEDAQARLDDALAALEDLGMETAEIQRQQTLNRALLHVAQAQWALAQDDWRFAQEEIARAATALSALEAVVDDEIGLRALDEAQTRLRLAYDKALTSPNIAARDLDAVWTLLQQTFPPPGVPALMGGEAPTTHEGTEEETPPAESGEG